MKKLVFIGLAIVAISCAENNSEKSSLGLIQRDSVNFSLLLNAIDGQDSSVAVGFVIEESIIDSMKLGDSTILKICSTSTKYASWDVKNKRSFRFRSAKKANLFIVDGELVVSIDGIASNAFGVEENVSTYIHFDKKGNLIKEGEYNAPKIWSL